ncbi:heterokaryon incompatibility protein-domain-containing protein [Xylaria cubensis]|nr:heterokaryon incompatibility protein-domain-containing protein [Xylaria cubensis]
MSSETKAYKYSNLSSSDSIRVFVLASSCDATGPIHGEIDECRISGSGEEQGYVALSYVWGSQHDTHEILLGKRHLHIGRNLDSALRHLRRRDRPIRLWVDAICINQHDVTERNHQVQQMRHIYSFAVETVIYLGDQTGSNTGLSAWNYLERKATWAMNDAGDPDPDLPKAREALIYFRGDLSDVGIDVLTRPWFRRLWVFQEVVVSKRLSIQCGNRRISWDDFCKVLLLTFRRHDQYGFSIKQLDKVSVVRDMFHARCAYQELYGMNHALPSWRFQVQAREHNILDILNLLQLGRQLRASDPRDRIFGLLGVCRGIEVNDQRFAIDYNQDCGTVYANFARNFMQARKSYDLLSYILGDVHRVPSWVPNWDSGYWDNRQLGRMRTILSTLEPETEQEKLERKQLFHVSCSWIGSGNILRVYGSVIGKISYLSGAIVLKSRHEVEFQEIRDIKAVSEDDREVHILKYWSMHFRLDVSEFDYESSSDNDALSQYMLNRSEERRLRSTPSKNFSNFLEECWSFEPPGTKPRFKKGVVEHHLLTRSRKTLSYTNSTSTPDTVIIDETSVVDGRRIALYSLSGSHPYMLALVPGGTKEGDYLIDLRGGRVPFTVRFDVEKSKDKDLCTGYRIERCSLIGESLVNRGAENSARRNRVFLIK